MGNTNREIECPNCHITFEIDGAGYAAIVKQVHDSELAKEVEKYKITLDELKDAELKQITTNAERDLDKAISKKDARIQELESELQIVRSENTSALQEAQHVSDQRYTKTVSEKDAKIQALQYDLQRAREELTIALEKAQLEADNLLTKAVSEKDSQIQLLKSQLQDSVKDKDSALREAKLEAEINLASEIAKKDKEIASLTTTISNNEEQRRSEVAHYTELIASLREFRAKLSTKMIGESLERHCFDEFEKIRPLITGSRIEFYKDNDASGGSKGDFIYREYNDDDIELISIMFEMKNEDADSTTKQKNEKIFAKLDKDRCDKKCEYAVLVSMLEPDSELYNMGIVDVSHYAPKMYVIRPQFFIPIISILRNAARNADGFKRRISELENSQADFQRFETAVEEFKTKFQKDHGLAVKDIESAKKQIQESIDRLS